MGLLAAGFLLLPLAFYFCARAVAQAELAPPRRQPELTADALTVRGSLPEAPAGPGPSPVPAQGEVLVESGSFRVDLGRTMDKLREFNLFDPDAFLLPWIRCAAASGASEISVTRTKNGLRLYFDGAALPERSLVEPYACLFDDATPDRERALYLAHGMLAAMRHRPRLIRVVSGVGSVRRCLRVGRLAGQDQGEPPPDPRTFIEVILDGWWPRWKARRFLKCLKPLLPAKPIKFAVDEKVVPEAALAPWPYGTIEKKPGFRVMREERDYRDGPAAVRDAPLRLYKHAVLVGEYEVSSADWAQALLNDDGFTLDLSGGDVVRNDAWESAIRRIVFQGSTVGPRLG
ncbi:MAG: hypothetical protein HY748_01490 [Elusimicrobia bacterium]|nr:hypothetical protein [Elusimicrobiota bacterium]